MCREQLPVWQSFYERHREENFELIGVAMDAAGPENAKKFYEQAGVTFVRGIDRADALWETLGFQAIPNGLFLDEQGVVRYAKFGGFEPRDGDEIERLLAAPVSRAPMPGKQRPAAPASVADVNSSGHWFRLGVEALQKGDRETAARHWRKALELDPKNFVIRKQIWAMEHPGQFYPAINLQWQREQLALEKKK